MHAAFTHKYGIKNNRVYKFNTKFAIVKWYCSQKKNYFANGIWWKQDLFKNSIGIVHKLKTVFLLDNLLQQDIMFLQVRIISTSSESHSIACSFKDFFTDLKISLFTSILFFFYLSELMGFFKKNCKTNPNTAKPF